MLDWFRILGSIILIDLVLSGDNALVIGAVAASLRSKFRWIAFFVGGGGAILVRILLTYSFTILLQVPYLETVGGVLLLIIAVRLLLDSHEEQGEHASSSPKRERNNPLSRFMKRHNILMAILTILVADLTTSLDNIVAIAALARNNTILLIAGLLLSITLLLLGSAIISRLIERLPWLILVAAVILAITAGQLVLQDQNIFDLILPSLWQGPTVYAAVTAIMLIPCVIWLRNYSSNSAA